MEEAGRIRRGYFIAGFGATQFASAGALDLLRAFRDEPEEPETLLLSATDPTNPYGALLKWPQPGLMRVAGASVVLVNGALAAYLARGEKNLDVFLPEDEPARSLAGREVAKAVASLVTTGQRRALLLKEVTADAGPFLAEAGFVKTAMGWQKRA
jgi:ATP-dependent Lhr-like helicase